MRFSGRGKDDEDNLDKENIDNFFDDEDFKDEDFEEFMEESNMYKGIKLTELSLVEANLNRRILVCAVKTMEQSFWWKFLSYKTRLKRIEETYRLYLSLIDQN